LGFVAGIIGFAWLFFRLVPSGDYKPKKINFSQAEIGAYDHEIPKYFLVAAFSLVLGSFHAVVKNLPGFWQWLWKAGYGGHLFRDLSNSHIIIVGGGTIMLTAITCMSYRVSPTGPCSARPWQGCLFGSQSSVSLDFILPGWCWDS
jgi:hypothetical protein